MLFNTLYQLNSYSISLSSKAVTDDTNGGATTGLTEGGTTNVDWILGILGALGFFPVVWVRNLYLCIYIRRRTGEYCFISNILLDSFVCVFVLFLNYILANTLA